MLSMLWEQTDPEVALRRRFGCVDATDATRRLTRALSRHWELPVSACRRLVLSSQNLLAWVTTPAGPYVVKVCADVDALDRLGVVAEIVADLGEQGLPVAAPRRTVDGSASARDDDKGSWLLVVLPEIGGDFVDAADPVAVRATGETLARIHLRLTHHQQALPGSPPLSAAERRFVVAAGDHARSRATQAAARLDALLEELPELDAPPALVHGDVRGANVLVADQHVAALLDFDALQVGDRVLDLAAAAAKLATRFRTWDPPPAGAAEQLLAGYRSVLPVSATEEQWFRAGVLSAGLSQIPPGPDPAGWAAAVELGL